MRGGKGSILQSLRTQQCFMSSGTLTFQIYRGINHRSSMTPCAIDGYFFLNFLLTVHRNLEESHVTLFIQSRNVTLDVYRIYIHFVTL